MKRILSILPVLLLLAACGDRVTISTGEIGRQLTSNGLEDVNRQPGSFRMDWCAPWEACPKLIRVQTQKQSATISITSLFLPKSNVDLSNVEIGLQYRIKPNKESINEVFKDITPEQVGERELVITTEKVFQTYIARKAPDGAVAMLRNYTVEEILSNVPEIAKATKDKVNEMLSGTPVEVTELGFPNGIGEVPDQVIEAKRLLFAVEENKARRVKELEAELAIEDQRLAVQRKRASNDRMVARETGITYSEYVMLKNMERFADAAEHGTPVALGGQYIPMTK